MSLPTKYAHWYSRKNWKYYEQIGDFWYVQYRTTLEQCMKRCQWNKRAKIPFRAQPMDSTWAFGMQIALHLFYNKSNDRIGDPK
jgi:hypothetical protein